jgi:three-Cys-motif partner protein
MMANSKTAQLNRAREDSNNDSVSYLKHVSRIKHEIFNSYFGAWAAILSKSFKYLAYFDCFAGDGRYVDEHGQPLPGSPQRAVGIATHLVSKTNGLSLTLGFIERDEAKAARLRADLTSMATPPGLKCSVLAGDARDLVDQILKALQNRMGTVPTLFFVDPYGHPLPVPILKSLLAIPKAEVLVNLMWYRISMDLGNVDRFEHFNYMFGHERWIDQKFMRLTCRAREESFLEYFEQEVAAPYRAHFPMPYSPEDGVAAPDKRRKFYLVHFSSHPRAATAMKAVMHRAEKNIERLYGSPNQPSFGFAEPGTLRVAELTRILCATFHTRQQVTFRELLDWTANLPYFEPEYRQALKQLDDEGKVQIDRRESKRTGLADGDIIRFL